MTPGFSMTEELGHFLVRHGEFVVWRKIPPLAIQLRDLGLYNQISSNSMVLTRRGKQVRKHYETTFKSKISNHSKES